MEKEFIRQVRGEDRFEGIEELRRDRDFLKEIDCRHGGAASCAVESSHLDAIESEEREVGTGTGSPGREICEELRAGALGPGTDR